MHVKLNEFSDISLNTLHLAHEEPMMNMSNQSTKGKTTRYAIIAVLIIAIIAGGLYYQFNMVSSNSMTS